MLVLYPPTSLRGQSLAQCLGITGLGTKATCPTIRKAAFRVDRQARQGPIPKKVAGKVGVLPDPHRLLKHFSHLRSLDREYMRSAVQSFLTATKSLRVSICLIGSYRTASDAASRMMKKCPTLKLPTTRGTMARNCQSTIKRGARATGRQQYQPTAIHTHSTIPNREVLLVASSHAADPSLTLMSLHQSRGKKITGSILACRMQPIKDQQRPQTPVLMQNLAPAFPTAAGSIRRDHQAQNRDLDLSRIVWVQV